MGKGSLNQAAFVDTAARAVVVIDTDTDGRWRAGTPGCVLPSFALNGLLKCPAQTEPSGLNVYLHVGCPLSLQCASDFRVAPVQEKAENECFCIRKKLMNDVRPLNLKHLRYFAEVARRGSVVQAARTLFVTPQTVSGQVQELEESVGQPLFERAGRRLQLTTAGQSALDYANQIFALSDELAQVLQGVSKPRSIRLRIAATDSLPKLLTVAALQKVIERHRDQLELECREGAYADLLGQLAVGQLDAVLADAPVPASLARVLEAKMVSESGMTFLAAKPLARRLVRGFPKSLQDAPFLIGSAPRSLLSQAIQAWFARQGVRAHIVGRIEDSALLQGFAAQGLGVATVPTSIATEVMRQSHLGVVGSTEEVRQTVFLVRPRGRRPHPFVGEMDELHGRGRQA
jgi:LysR family transcriptional regulator, transcriptional activator of nhaA